MKSRYRLALLLILLAAFALRLHHLDAQSLWYDEGVSARVAQMSLPDLARWTADDIQPPLYYTLLHGWLHLTTPWVGNLAWLMRFLSASFGLLLLPLLALLGRKLWGRCAGLLTALIAGISPLMVYYSQEARMYTLLLFWLTLAAWAVVKLLDEMGRAQRERQRLRWLGLYVVSGLAALYTHYFAAFALLALALYWAHVWIRESCHGEQNLTSRGHARKDFYQITFPFAPLRLCVRPRALVGFALANALILLGFAPWLPKMLHRLQNDSSYWPGRLKLDEALWHIANHFSVGATEVFREEAARAWLPWFGLALLLVLIALWLRQERGKQRPMALVLHWLLLPPLLTLMLSWRTPKFNPRYLLMSWPAWALLLGAGAATLWQARQRWARALAAALLLLILLTSARSLDNWFSDPNFAKTGWREAVGYAATHHQPDEVALLVSGHAYPIFDVYMPADTPPKWQLPRVPLPEIEILDVNQVLGWQETAQALNTHLAGRSGVWLFLWQNQVIDPADTTRTMLQRYAQQEPTPQFSFLGLEHYRLPRDFAVPEQPPTTLPGHAFASGLTLTGLEPAPGGLWLYWQAQRPALPDLTATFILTQSGQEMLHQDQRPLGYDFPTTHWTPGETYAQWLPAPGPLAGAHLRITMHDAGADEAWETGFSVQ